METAANIQWLERDLSPRRARILNLETISALRKQKEELLKEIAVQKELEEKIEKKWKEGEMGKKWKQLKRMDPTPKVKAEQQKLMEIRDITRQRMADTTKRLLERLEEITQALTSAENSVSGTVRRLRGQSVQQTRDRIEALIKRRPSIEELIYRGIYLEDPERPQRNRQAAKLGEFFSSRKTDDCGTYSSAWMFPADAELQEQREKAAAELRRKHEEFVELLKKENCLIDFEEIEDLVKVSEGAFGNVYCGKYRGQVVAVKRLKPRADCVKIAQAEVLCLLLARNNPYVIKLVGACVDPYAIVTPFYPAGSLFDLIHVKKARITLEQALSIAVEIANGCRLLHSMQPPLMHRDLSSSNILLSDQGKPIIIDFGISREETSEFPTHLSPIGHPRLKAPEISRRQPYTKSVDVYNFGAVLYELVCHEVPFADLPAHEAALCTARGLTPPIPESVPHSIAKLMLECWSMQPERRPTFQQLVFRLKKIAEEISLKPRGTLETTHAEVLPY